MTGPRSLRVFLSSPGDVAEERALAEIVFRRLTDEVADAAHLELVIWEHEPLFGHTSFQPQIPRPSQCDLVVCILWSRLGTRLPDDFSSPEPGLPPPTGTEFELNDALEAHRRLGRPKVLIYRKIPGPQVGLGSPEFEERGRQYQALDQFCQRAFYDARGAITVAHHTFSDGHDFERRLAEHVRRWIDSEIRSTDALALLPRWRGGSPFRGLQTFEAEHQAIFFGRSEALGDLVRRIRDAENPASSTPPPHLLVLQGMSGTGKTSLIKAGLLPLLGHRPVEGIALWYTASVRPSESTPTALQTGSLGVLAARLCEQLPSLERLGTDITRLATSLGERPEEALARIETCLAAEAERVGTEPRRARLLVFVDQLEEAFTLDETAAHASRLFAALAALARSPAIWVVATLRSDFAHRLEAHPALMQCLSGSPPYTLPPPRADEFADIIREPALAAGLLWETRDGVSLDQELLRDATGNPEALPLLEYTLQELYDRRDGRLLLWAAYEGGLRGALIAAAEDVVSAQAEEADTAFRDVMRELVGVAEDGTATRRYAPLSRFRPNSPARALLDRLVARRLCVTTDRGRGAGPVASLAHEALIRSWPRAQSWLQTETVLLRLRDELLRDADVWERHGHSDSWLGVAPEKLAAIRQVEQAELLPPGGASDYAQRSRRRAARNMMLKSSAIIGICVLAIVSLVAGFVAFKQRNLAVLEQASADRTTQFMVSMFAVADPGENRGNTITVRELLDKGAKEIGQGLQREPRIRADLLTAMGRAYSGLGLYAPAEKLLAMARSDQASTTVPEVSRVQTLIASGSTLYLAGDYDGALKLLREAVNAARLSLPPSSALRSGALTALADDLVRLEKYDEAEQACLEALAADRYRGPEESAVLGNTLSTLATVYYYKGDLKSAEAPMREALKLREQAFGERHALTAESISNLAAVLYMTGRYSEALSLLRKALPIYRDVYGPEHPQTATLINNIARTALMLGRVDEAEPLFRQTLAMDEKLKDPTHDDLVAPLNSLGMIDAYLGRWDQAHSELARAEAIARLPEHGALLDQVLLNAADLELHAGHRDRAAALLRESRQLLEKAYPAPDKDPSNAWRYAVWDTVNAQLLAADGNSAAATQALAAAQPVIARRFGAAGFYSLLAARRAQQIKSTSGGA